MATRSGKNFRRTANAHFFKRSAAERLLMSYLDTFEPVKFQRLRLFFMHIPFRTRTPLPLARKRSIQRIVSFWVPMLLGVLLLLLSL